MTTNGGSISVSTSSHPSGFIVVPLKVGPLYTLELLLNTGFVMTCLRPGMRDSLAALGHLRTSGGRFLELHDITLGGASLPPLLVRTNRLVERFEVDGMLGLNFFGQFREVCFDVSAQRLTLKR